MLSGLCVASLRTFPCANIMSLLVLSTSAEEDDQPNDEDPSVKAMQDLRDGLFPTGTVTFV